MTPSLAAFIATIGILGLFILDRDPRAKTSWALCIPGAWLLIAGSQHVSQWLGIVPDMSQDQYMEGSPLDAAIYGLLIAAGMIVLYRRRRAVASLLQRNHLLLWFVLYCMVSIVWSDYPGISLKRWIKSLGDYVVVLIMLTEHHRSTAVKQILARVAFLLMPLSILFIKYYPEIGRRYASHWDSTQFFTGVCDNKNTLGMVCMIFGFAGAWRVLQALRGPRHERTKLLIVHGAVLAMAVWLLVVSDSKTSLSCFVLTIGLVAAHTFVKVARRRFVLTLLVSGVIFASSAVLFLGVGSGALEALGRNATLTGRTEIWAVLFKVPINPILGTGFESFWLGKRLAFLWTFPIVKGINEAHDGYLEMYLNLGIVGLILLAAFLWTGYKNILRLLDRDPEAGRLCLGFFIIAVVYNFTEAGFRSINPVWIAFIFAIVDLPAIPLVRVRAPKQRRATAVVLEPSLAGHTPMGVGAHPDGGLSTFIE